MKTAQQLLDAQALGEIQLSGTVVECLKFVARGDIRCHVVLGKTRRMEGDLEASVQAQEINVWAPGSNRLLVGYFVADDAGWYGGPVTHSVDGNAWVAAEYVDGVHRLDVTSGELVDPEVIL